ncbi:MAG: hypothetical protein PHH70_01560 [Candidatus Gracilibacteria bacterium]|nr:hypothetical protein [Candidatus Gracilibacteria bacterium]
MSGMHYALVQELGAQSPLFIDNGLKTFPSDIAMDQGIYYRIYNIADDVHNLLTDARVQKFTIKRVQKILGSGDGDVKWKILT